MFVVSELLTTLHGKIVAGVLVTSFAAGTGVLAVKAADVKVDSQSTSRGVAAESGSKAAAKDKASSQSAAQAGAYAENSASDPAGAFASAKSGTNGAGLAGSAGISANPGVAVLKPGVLGGQNGGGSLTTPWSGGGSGGSNPITTPQSPSLPGNQELPQYGTPTPAPPSTTLPSGVEVYRSGSYSVVVPASEGDGQQLCLEGTLVNKCRTVTIPPTKAVTITFSYDGNASATAPTFTVNPCERGVEIGLSGLTPGSTVNAQAEGSTLSAEIDGKPAGQNVSFCKA
jgi:hypothetical protein